MKSSKFLEGWPRGEGGGGGEKETSVLCAGGRFQVEEGGL